MLEGTASETTAPQLTIASFRRLCATRNEFCDRRSPYAERTVSRRCCDDRVIPVPFDQRFDLGDVVAGQDDEVALDRVQEAKVFGPERKLLGAGDVAALAEELAVTVT